MIYFIAPVVVLRGVSNTPLSKELLMLPVLVFLLCSVIGLTCYKIYSMYALNPKEANLIPLSVGTGNTGYFGIPIALLLLGEEHLPVYIMCMLGTTLFESSVGFYMANNKASLLKGIISLLKLPVLYAFFFGLALNAYGANFPMWFDLVSESVLIAYSVIGMMLIGMGLSNITEPIKDKSFVVTVFFGKFFIWPLIVGVLTVWDYYTSQIFNLLVYQALMIIALTPVAANCVVIANFLKLPVENMAKTTLYSSIFALFYIPLVVTLLTPLFG